MANYQKARFLMYVLSTLIGAVSGYFGNDIGKTLMSPSGTPFKTSPSEVSSQTLP